MLGQYNTMSITVWSMRIYLYKQYCWDIKNSSYQFGQYTILYDMVTIMWTNSAMKGAQSWNRESNSNSMVEVYVLACQRCTTVEPIVDWLYVGNDHGSQLGFPMRTRTFVSLTTKRHRYFCMCEKEDRISPFPLEPSWSVPRCWLSTCRAWSYIFLIHIQATILSTARMVLWWRTLHTSAIILIRIWTPK